MAVVLSVKCKQMHQQHDECLRHVLLSLLGRGNRGLPGMSEGLQNHWRLRFCIHLFEIETLLMICLND
jgi:hypothetical protein